MRFSPNHQHDDGYICLGHISVDSYNTIVTLAAVVMLGTLNAVNVIAILMAATVCAEGFPEKRTWY